MPKGSPELTEARTSIYNYFQTKEEIFLALLQREYELWIFSLKEKMEQAVYGEAIRTVRSGLDRYFPDMSASGKQDFIYTFFPFMFGIYPYTFVTEKQKTAMEEANVSYVFMTIYEITFNCVKKLLK